MAATAAASGPAAPIAWLSRAASGMSVAAEGPSTLIVATARPRYSTVVTASAMATARGSCRAGSANRVVSGANASQPAKENISDPHRPVPRSAAPGPLARPEPLAQKNSKYSRISHSLTSEPAEPAEPDEPADPGDPDEPPEAPEPAASASSYRRISARFIMTR